MSSTDLKERLIDKILEIENNDLLAEAYRLLSSEADSEEPFKLTADQKSAIAEARQQNKNGAFLTIEEA